MGSLSIPNLIPGKKYAIQVRTVGNNGQTSAWSETVTFTSPQNFSNALSNSYTTTMTDNGQLLAGGMKFGSNVNGTNSGISIDSTNYWYSSGLFSIGNGTTQSVTWDGSTFAIAGKVTATTGKIGGWSIDSTSLYYAGTGTAKIYIGAGNWGNSDTNFYVEQSGKFSLGSGLTWDPTAPATLNVNGVLRGYINSTTAAPIIPANTMGVGLYNSSNSTDGVYGVGLKLNSTNYWFADNNARINVGSTSKYFSYNEQSGTLQIVGDITANSGKIGGATGWSIGPGTIYSGTGSSFIGLSNVSGTGTPTTYTIDKILIDSEGSGFSSIYIRISYSDSLLLSNLISKLILLPTSGVSGTMWGLLTANPALKWTIQDAGRYDYAFDGFGNAYQTSTLLTNKAVIIIYGEENNINITSDDTPTITSSPAITMTTVLQSEPGLWMGNEVFNNSPLRLKSDGSGKIGGFKFYPTTSASPYTGIFVTDNSDTAFTVGSGYTPPTETKIDPIYGLGVTAKKSLGDAGLFFSTWNGTSYPTGEAGWLSLMKGTGLTIGDTTGSASQVYINPYVGIRAESVSKLNVAKNGSFEYKVNLSDTSYTSSTSGWTAGTGLSITTLDGTTSGYSFPSFPYGQKYMGSLSWTTVVSTYLSTGFRLDPDGTTAYYSYNGTALTIGKSSFHTDFALYNVSSSGKFNTETMIAYPTKDITVSYTNTSNTTSTITSSSMSNSGTAISSKSFYDSSITNLINYYNSYNSSSITLPTFSGGYAYVTSQYGTPPKYTVSSVSRTTPSSTVVTTSSAHGFAIGDSIILLDSQNMEYQFYVKTVPTTTTFTIDDYQDSLLGTTISTVNYEYLVQDSTVTRTKNNIEFDILASAYSNAKYTNDFTLNLPGYIYTTTISIPTAKTITFSRAQSGTVANTIYNGFAIESINLDPAAPTAYTYTALSAYLTTSATTAVIDSSVDGIPSTGSYDLPLDSFAPNGYGYANAAYTNTATSVVLYGDTTNTMLSYFPVNSYVKIIDSVTSAVQYAKITSASFSAGLLTLGLTRGQLGVTATAIAIDSQFYVIERINVTSVSSSTTYTDLNLALSQGLDISTATISATTTKVASTSIGFDELTISDQSISYFDGSTGGGTIWGVDASKPGIWSYSPPVVVAQLGGSPQVIGNSSGLSLIKNISYEPYTYLMTNPSIYVQAGTGSYIGQSVTSISGGKYSLTSNNPRIDLVAGNTSAVDGRMDFTTKLATFTGALTIGGILTIPLNSSVPTTIAGGYLVRDTWHNVSFQNSWTNYAVSTFGYASYRLYPDGTVHLKGLIKNATTSKTGTIFTLPSGYRPANSKIYQCIAGGNGEARVDISAGGVVSVYNYKNGGTGAFISLEGVIFDVAGI